MESATVQVPSKLSNIVFIQPRLLPPKHLSCMLCQWGFLHQLCKQSCFDLCHISMKHPLHLLRYAFIGRIQSLQKSWCGLDKTSYCLHPSEYDNQSYIIQPIGENYPVFVGWLMWVSIGPPYTIELPRQWLSRIKQLSKH